MRAENGERLNDGDGPATTTARATHRTMRLMRFKPNSRYNLARRVLQLSLMLLGASATLLLQCWLAENGWLGQTLPQQFPLLARSVLSLGLGLGTALILLSSIAWLGLDQRTFRTTLLSAVACLLAGALLWEKQSLGSFKRLDQEWIGAHTQGDDAYLYWCNAVSIDAPQRLKDLITQNPQQNWTLVLANNSGGSTEAMMTAYDELTKLGVKRVLATGKCNSACALLWSLMPERALMPGAVLGFHGPYTATGLPAGNRDALIQALTQAGMNAKEARRLMSIGSNELFYMDGYALQQAGLRLTVTNQQWKYRPTQCGNSDHQWDGTLVLNR